ncbi:MAG: hypothetical protein ACOYXB_03150 [Bacteroidota bacterium]
MKKSLFVFVLSFILYISCDDIFPGLTFTGITETNIDGEILSSDPSDWNLTDDWNRRENNLFEEGFEDICENSPHFIVSAYPNPCTEVLHVNLPSSDSTRTAIRIVKSNFEVLISLDSVPGCLLINFRDFDLQGEIVRIYYKILGENCEYRGHGDIQIN